MPMVHQSTPRSRRAHRAGPVAWFAAWLVILGLVPGAVSQETKSAPGTRGTAPEGQADPADPAAEPTEGEKAAEAQREQSVLEDNVFVDPRATEAMANSFEELFARDRFPLNPALTRMARGEIRVDSTAIERHIRAAVRDLTDHDNIEAVLNREGTGDARRIQTFEEAGLALIQPLSVPVDQRRSDFTREYGSRLLQVGPELLKNHLLARTEYVLALSRLADPAALDLLSGVVGDPNQPVILKQLAAQGIAAIAQAAGRGLPVAQSAAAAEALDAFIQRDEEHFWPAKVRALEALGRLRTISTIQRRDEALMAQTALHVLASPKYRPEIRAWAGWTLGMLDVPPGYPQVNYSLIAYHLGKLAAELGDGVLAAQEVVTDEDGGEETVPQQLRINYLTALMVYQVYYALIGDPTVRDSGILGGARTLGEHDQYVRRMQEAIRRLATGCVEYSRAVGGRIGPARDEVVAALEALRTLLQQSPPASDLVVPAAEPLQIAEAPATASAAAEEAEPGAAEGGGPDSR